MLGGNSLENRELELKLFSNGEVLAVNQPGENPKQLYKKDGGMVWVSNVKGSKDLYVGLFNITDATQEVFVDFMSLVLKGKVAVRDLWKIANLGVLKKKYAQNISAHGSVLLRLTVK